MGNTLTINEVNTKMASMKTAEERHEFYLSNCSFSPFTMATISFDLLGDASIFERLSSYRDYVRDYLLFKDYEDFEKVEPVSETAKKIWDEVAVEIGLSKASNSTNEALPVAVDSHEDVENAIFSTLQEIVTKGNVEHILSLHSFDDMMKEVITLFTNTAKGKLKSTGDELVKAVNTAITSDSFQIDNDDLEVINKLITLFEEAEKATKDKVIDLVYNVLKYVSDAIVSNTDVDAEKCFEEFMVQLHGLLGDFKSDSSDEETKEEDKKSERQIFSFDNNKLSRFVINEDGSVIDNADEWTKVKEATIKSYPFMKSFIQALEKHGLTANFKPIVIGLEVSIISNEGKILRTTCINTDGAYSPFNTILVMTEKPNHLYPVPLSDKLSEKFITGSLLTDDQVKELDRTIYNGLNPLELVQRIDLRTLKVLLNSTDGKKKKLSKKEFGKLCSNLSKLLSLLKNIDATENFKTDSAIFGFGRFSSVANFSIQSMTDAGVIWINFTGDQIDYTITKNGEAPINGKL